ncbi:MAG TPA: metallophosphoesterase [Anaeromyxobacteraceae bacterium]|nr:metallophosphoesterase [Anaeromyxobacteraceae bacterium]
MSTFGRREFLAGTIAAGAAAAIPARASAARQVAPAVTETPTFLVPGLDPAHEGLKVAQLSDLHVGPKTPPGLVRAAIEEVNRFEPDLVALTGDFLSFRRSEVDTMRQLLGGLAAPTFAVLGNHDHWVDPRGAREALLGLGYEVIDNAWTTIRLRGAPLAVVGVGDLSTGNADVPLATRGLPPQGTPLVLAHGPSTADPLAALGRAALCLSGHTHGGQIAIPILTPLFVRAVLRERYVRGPYRVGPVSLYVNRGIGMSGLRTRVSCPAEVTLATLRAA